MRTISDDNAVSRVARVGISHSEEDEAEMNRG